MSDAREQRTPAEEAAELARSQTARQVDTWMSQTTARMERVWERSMTGRMSWRDAQRQQWPGAKAAEATAAGYEALKSQWRTTVRDPAVQEMVVWEAVEQQVVTPTVAAHYMEQHRRMEGTQGPPRPHGSLGSLAGREVYEQTLQTWGAQHREAPSTAPTDRTPPPLPTRAGEHDMAPSSTREQQAARFPEMAARGWGQSWDEQERGRDR